MQFCKIAHLPALLKEDTEDYLGSFLGASLRKKHRTGPGEKCRHLAYSREEFKTAFKYLKGCQKVM